MPKPTARRLARPARIRVSLFDDASGSANIPLPMRRTWPVGIVIGAMFAVFASIAVGQVVSMRGQEIDTVFDLMGVLFQGFWVLGWSVGVVILFLLTVLFFFYGESARVTRTHLIHVPRLGPLKIFLEYDLAEVRKPRVVKAGADKGRIRFDYRGAARGLGNDMPRAEAEKGVVTIRSAIEALGVPARRDPTDVPAARAVAPPPPPPTEPATEPSVEAASVSTLALLGANLVPLAGVLLLRWELGHVMTLFWAENAVIGFYGLLRLAVIAKWGILFAGPAFLGGFGAFMAGHFMFIYYLFVRGITTTGPEPAVLGALADLFVPLWPALLALLISHGISFRENFLGRREYVGRSIGDQMGEPYKRIFILHVTIIFGGWAILLLKSRLPALVLLIAIKTAVDVRAHRKEHGRAD